jgi:hypothetical protein
MYCSIVQSALGKLSGTHLVTRSLESLYFHMMSRRGKILISDEKFEDI